MRALRSSCPSGSTEGKSQRSLGMHCPRGFVVSGVPATLEAPRHKRGMPYGTSFDIYSDRARTLLGDGTLTREQLVMRGLPLGALKMLQRHGVIRPKMTPWLNAEGKRIGAIECWQMAPLAAPRPPREDCALMDFVAMGIA